MNCLMITALILCATTANADWTTIRGNTQRTGYIDAEIKTPFHVAWVRHFAEERLGTAMEPIVAEGKLFVATHSGNLYALDALTGKPIWNFKAKGALLHSPAFADNIIVAASTDGYLYALDGENFVDLPDFSMDAFRATAWLQNVEPLRELNRRFDIPLCRADLNYIIKLSIILEQSR